MAALASGDRKRGAGSRNYSRAGAELQEIDERQRDEFGAQNLGERGSLAGVHARGSRFSNAMETRGDGCAPRAVSPAEATAAPAGRTAPTVVSTDRVTAIAMPSVRSGPQVQDREGQASRDLQGGGSPLSFPTPSSILFPW